VDMARSSGSCEMVCAECTIKVTGIPTDCKCSVSGNMLSITCDVSPSKAVTCSACKSS
jgi:hypothetical protein